MKKLYILLALSAFGFTANAQYVLTSSHTPQIGDIDMQANDTIPAVAPGNGGMNLNWDFSGLNNHFTSQTNFVDPQTTPHASEFPTSNLAIQEEGFYGYLESNNGVTSMIGLAIDQDMFSGTADVSPADTAIVIPSAFEDTYTDYSNWTVTTYFGQEVQGFTIDSIRITESKTELVEFDAYGSVKTPLNTFDNSLREKITIDNHTTVEVLIGFLGWQAFQDTIIRSYEYNWIAEGEKFPVASVTTNSSGEATSASYNLDVEISVNENLANNNAIKFFPNPVVETAAIVGTEKNQIANIYDVQGKLVMTKALNEGITNVNLKALSKGNYNIQIMNNNTVVETVAFIKQ